MKRYKTYQDENIAWKRCELLGEYLITYGSTVRDAASHFGISKSTVHKDVGMRLEKINKCLYIRVKSVLETNKSERHIRGGMATKNKYEKNKKPL